jgi:mRNA-degrading endonuclease toxin of MazEF toxin-antitoxin module
MTTAEIAESLLAAGVQTKAANFANNVSAVLSTTMREQPHGEVQLSDGKWQLTEKGKAAIDYIRTTPKFRGAVRGIRAANSARY